MALANPLLRLVTDFVKLSRLSELSVPVIAGPLKPGWWTLYPFTSYWRGTHERDVVREIEAWLPKAGESAWDVGAHFGFYTVILARRVGIGGQVAAFEPDTSAYRKLERHVQINHLAHVRTFPFAASAAPGIRFLFQSDGRGAATSHLAYPGEHHDLTTPGSWIPTTTLDELVSRNIIREPDFIKIDAEGHGGQVLQGAARAISARTPKIFMSFHCPEEIDVARSQLGGMGYRGIFPDGSVAGWDRIHGREVLFLPGES